jgi:hypothetical protein
MNVLKNFKKGMALFGSDIALIVNSILLSIVYIIGVGFTSIISKILGKSFIEKKIHRKKNSYWTNLNLKKNKIDKYYRLF